MYQVVATLRSISPYQQRQQITLPKLEREDAQAYENRTWRETAHYTSEGFVMIPPSQLTKAIQNAARYLKLAMPGKRGATFLQPMLSSVTCLHAPVTRYTRHDIVGVTVSVPADGKPGGGKRVPRTFPTLEQWDGKTTWYIYDEIVTPPVFEQHLKVAGLLVGLGVWRVQKGGMYGRFEVEHCEVQQLTL